MTTTPPAPGLRPTRSPHLHVLGRNGALILLGITPKPLTTSAGLTFSYQG
ncbi:hypothetical protein [Nonomuraea roseoviolacea]|uniref:Uncharacterized protein n=1 Tax=Nonomuraea roseoviolacea subsp. carminata TaxID=160689 RepID=A0ABT1JQF9_9ACTN|nr:hypothetical protein [Nonomuraea roseoviolacea]MCP2343963.1 hypothetical protein [Nonomuraea roseoviolacea subsp. carminata]